MVQAAPCDTPDGAVADEELKDEEAGDRLVQELLDAELSATRAVAGGLGGGGGAAALEVALADLEDLRRNGFLSEAEYTEVR